MCDYFFGILYHVFTHLDAWFSTYSFWCFTFKFFLLLSFFKVIIHLVDTILSFKSFWIHILWSCGWLPAFDSTFFHSLKRLCSIGGHHIFIQVFLNSYKYYDVVGDHRFWFISFSFLERVVFHLMPTKFSSKYLWVYVGITMLGVITKFWFNFFYSLKGLCSIWWPSSHLSLFESI
jgi:hypothetical protein